MNRVQLLGRLTRDPDVRYTETGKPVATFTLAVNRTTKDQNGQYLADFVPVVLWGKPAELVGNSTIKGHRLLVEGRLQIRTYEDKTGQKHWITEVIANSVEFIEKRGDNATTATGAEETAGDFEQLGKVYEAEIAF